MKIKRNSVLILLLIFISLPLCQAYAQKSKSGDYATLIDGNESTKIKYLDGNPYKMIVPMYGYRNYILYDPSWITVNTSNNMPKIVIESNDDPRELYWFVHLVKWKENNSLVLDLDSPSIWQGTAASNEPIKENIIQFNAKEDKPGIWSITPKKELIPGVYGLFRWAANKTNRSRLFGFEVRKPEQKVDNTISHDAPSSTKYSDIIGVYLTDGTYIKGSVVSVENSRMKIKTADGVKSYSIINDIDRFDRN